VTDGSSQPNVRHAIESHLLDSSPAVRDAAVDLIGKYMIDSPAVTGSYYPRIAERIAVHLFHAFELLVF
jgi:cohesin loading factor subunit SCC2